MKKVFLAVAAASMTFSGAASAGQPLRASQAVPAAVKVSADAPVQRASKRADAKMDLAGSGWLIALLALAAVVAGTAVALDGKSNG